MTQLVKAKPKGFHGHLDGEVAVESARSTETKVTKYL